MEKTDTVYLEDIQNCITRIQEYTYAMSLADFSDDTKTQDAVMRNLELIGEAANRLSDSFCQENPNFPIVEAVSLRNFLIHDYDEIDIKVVWKTLKEDIPSLNKEVEKILG